MQLASKEELSVTEGKMISSTTIPNTDSAIVINSPRIITHGEVPPRSIAPPHQSHQKARSYSRHPSSFVVRNPYHLPLKFTRRYSGGSSHPPATSCNHRINRGSRNVHPNLNAVAVFGLDTTEDCREGSVLNENTCHTINSKCPSIAGADDRE